MSLSFPQSTLHAFGTCHRLCSPPRRRIRSRNNYTTSNVIYALWSNPALITGAPFQLDVPSLQILAPMNNRWGHVFTQPTSEEWNQGGDQDDMRWKKKISALEQLLKQSQSEIPRTGLPT